MLIKFAALMGLKELTGRNPREVRSVFLLLISCVFVNADFFLIGPNIKVIMAEFGKTELDLGVVSSVFVFFGAAVALLVGYLTDKYPRKPLVIITIVLGEIPCLLTGYVQTFNQLVAVRVLTGIGIGGIMPLIFSMIGDLVSERERSSAAAWIGLAEGLGLAAGQLLAGNLAESSLTLFGASGWRLPFVLVAIPAFAVAPLFWLFTDEPARGGGEKAVAARIEQGGEYQRRIRLSDYKVIFKNRTNLYFFLQAVPGTIGWGVLPFWIVYFYNVTKNVSIAMATNLSIVIGAGMIIGGFVGGIIGNMLHARDKRYLPILCGVTTLVGFGFFIVMIHYPLPSTPTVVNMIGPLAVGVVGGFFITITSGNVRAIVLNVNPPENRGAMMSLFTLADSIGKGAGPALGGVLMKAFGHVAAMDISILSWIPCGLVFLLLMTPQYPRDAAALDRLMEERAKEIQTGSTGLTG
jgi:MFS family permease